MLKQTLTGLICLYVEMQLLNAFNVLWKRSSFPFFKSDTAFPNLYSHTSIVLQKCVLADELLLLTAKLLRVVLHIIFAPRDALTRPDMGSDTLTSAVGTANMHT